MNMQIRRQSRLALLIADHKAATALANVLWDQVCEIENANDIPTPRVQTGNFLKGRDRDGNEIREPIYSYHEENIVSRYEETRDTMLFMHGKHPASAHRIKEQYARIISEKLEQFRTLTANAKLAEDACGFTAARDAATAQSAKASAILSEIVQAPCLTLADFRLAAGYLADLREASQIDEDYILDFLRLASSAVRSTLEVAA